jgi:hypothetical protein
MWISVWTIFHKTYTSGRILDQLEQLVLRSKYVQILWNKIIDILYVFGLVLTWNITCGQKHIKILTHGTLEVVHTFEKGVIRKRRSKVVH